MQLVQILHIMTFEKYNNLLGRIYLQFDWAQNKMSYYLNCAWKIFIDISPYS